MGRGKCNLKSVRLSDEVLEYLNSVPGIGFSEKFENAVLGAKRKQDEVARYEKMLEQRKKQLLVIDDLSQSLNIVHRAIMSLQRDAVEIEEKVTKIINDDS